MKRSPAISQIDVSAAILERVVKKAKRKGAQPWDVVGPLEKFGFADQVTILAQLFAESRLGPKQQVAIDSAAQALKLMARSAGDARPLGLAAAVVNLLNSLNMAPAEVPGMFPGYSHSLDMIVMWAYLLDSTPLEAIVDTLEGPARFGLETVRFRFGKTVPTEMQSTLQEGLARADGSYTSKWDTLVVGPDGLEKADDDEIEAIALRLGNNRDFRVALAAAAGTTRPLCAWLLPRLEASRVVSVIGSMDEKTLERLDDETIAALLDHPGTAEEFSDALAELPDTAKLGKTLLAIVTGAKRVDAGLPIPSPWPLYRSYDGFSDEVGKRLLVRALLKIHGAFPASRSHAYVGNALAAGFPDVMVALAAHPDPALIEQANGRFGAAEHPEARGLLLARLADSSPARGRKTKTPPVAMPDDRQLRLDYLLARCEALPADKRDPSWLDTLDLQEEIDFGNIWKTVWAESRILLAFSLDRRASVVLSALRGDNPKGHAIQLLRVLDEERACEALSAALTSTKLPPPNWLDWVMRVASLPGVEKPWTRESLLERSGAEVKASYRKILGID